jgi:hypothetical protein
MMGTVQWVLGSDDQLTAVTADYDVPTLESYTESE